MGVALEGIVFSIDFSHAFHALNEENLNAITIYTHIHYVVLLSTPYTQIKAYIDRNLYIRVSSDIGRSRTNLNE